jgi:hypothetical protein
MQILKKRKRGIKKLPGMENNIPEIATVPYHFQGHERGNEKNLKLIARVFRNAFPSSFSAYTPAGACQ